MFEKRGVIFKHFFQIHLPLTKKLATKFTVFFFSTWSKEPEKSGLVSVTRKKCYYFFFCTQLFDFSVFRIAHVYIHSVYLLLILKKS